MPFRFNKTDVYQDYIISPIYNPLIIQCETEEYYCRDGDTLESIAYNKYKDMSLWWILCYFVADFHNLSGKTVNIPTYDSVQYIIRRIL